MNKILVTGGAGFIGSNLIPLLLNKGYTVNAYDNLSAGKTENLGKMINHPNFKLTQADIRNTQTLHDSLKGNDAVIHLAALIDISASVADPNLTNEVNVTGTLNVLTQATKTNIKKLVFASSTAIYGDTKTLPVKEETPPHPISPYAASKAAGEAYCQAFTKCYDIQATALRFFNVYGPKNQNSPYSGVITKFLQKALKNQTLNVEGDGEQTRDFIHVTDVAKALLQALETKDIGGEVFNVCTGNPTSINNLVTTLEKAIGKKPHVTHGPSRVGDIRHSYGDPTKAANQLSFKTQISLLDGLKNLKESYT